jgi:hypothetical protein
MSRLAKGAKGGRNDAPQPPLVRAAAIATGVIGYRLVFVGED